MTAAGAKFKLKKNKKTKNKHSSFVCVFVFTVSNEPVKFLSPL